MPTPVVPWEQMQPAEVETVIAALLVRTHPGAVRVDGSGGDDGADVVLDTEAGQRVWEIKSFTGRLTSGRKRQIAASARAAKAKRPQLARWTLILPLDLTPAEQRWFGATVCAELDGVVAEWRGRSYLDGQMSERPDIARYMVPGSAERRAIELATQMTQETAALVGGLPDAIRRHQALARLTDTLDPDYAFEIRTSANRTTVNVRAKDEGAVRRSPVTATLRLQADPGTPFADELDRAMRYGTPLRATGEHVAVISVTGPDSIRALLPGPDAQLAALEICPVDRPPQTGWLTAYKDSVPIERLRIDLVKRGHGTDGGWLRFTDGAGSLTFDMFLAAGQEDATAKIAFDTAGLLPADALPAARLMSAVAVADFHRIAIAGMTPMNITVNTAQGEDAEHHARLVRLLDAYDRIQARAGQVIPMPATLSRDDATLIEMLGLLLDGDKPADLAGAPSALAAAPSIVQHFVSESGPLPRIDVRMTSDGPFEIGGHEFDLGMGLQFTYERMLITNATELKRTLADRPRAWPPEMQMRLATDSRTTGVGRLLPSGNK